MSVQVAVLAPLIVAAISAGISIGIAYAAQCYRSLVRDLNDRLDETAGFYVEAMEGWKWAIDGWDAAERRVDGEVTNG